MGTHAKSLDLKSPDISNESAKTFITWLERGVFEALQRGYLEKAILCMSADDSGNDMLEAWELSVDWHTDENGVAHPTLHSQGGKDGTRSSLKIRAPEPKKKFSQQYARECSQAMLRQLVRSPRPTRSSAAEDALGAALADDPRRRPWWHALLTTLGAVPSRRTCCSRRCRRPCRRCTGSRCACSTATT